MTCHNILAFYFQENKKIVLLLGGGEGIPRGLAIVSKLIEKNITAEIAVICGRNNELYNDLKSYLNRNNILHVKLFRYVDFVEKLIRISDVVITKCGASTFMEILVSKKIPVVIDYIWEQEKGNVDFLTENNLGIYEKRIGKLPGLITKIISGDKEYLTLRNNIINSEFKNGLNEVASFIMKGKS